MKKGIILVFGILLVLSFLGLVYAEKIDIEVKDSYVPGEEVKFKVVLYDDNSQKIQGSINYVVYDYYIDIVKQGSSNSGGEVVFKIPFGTEQKPWKITASYGDLNVNRLFNVGELKKAEITLEGDILILKNIGNVPYEKSILIYIGEQDQTASVSLDLNDIKRIRLIAPDGQYDIRVIEGNEENVLEFKGVRLTGNVIGLERVLGDNGFWQKNKIIVLFLGTLLLLVIVIAGSKAYKKYVK